MRLRQSGNAESGWKCYDTAGADERNAYKKNHRIGFYGRMLNSVSERKPSQTLNYINV